MGIGRITKLIWTSEQIMAFADSENDIEMLELAELPMLWKMQMIVSRQSRVTALAPANSQAGVYQIQKWLEKEG